MSDEMTAPATEALSAVRRGLIERVNPDGSLNLDAEQTRLLLSWLKRLESMVSMYGKLLKVMSTASTEHGSIE